MRVCHKSSSLNNRKLLLILAAQALSRCSCQLRRQPIHRGEIVLSIICYWKKGRCGPHWRPAESLLVRVLLRLECSADFLVDRPTAAAECRTPTATLSISRRSVTPSLPPLTIVRDYCNPIPTLSTFPAMERPRIPLLQAFFREAQSL